ncbi:exonuclease SbcC [Stutzerimonas kirkiae]|uniref:Nuclease SbcCD subunit C n=1 Tax=Stutzerimonas kirkiae TaxID=2211392 RepID=A0A4Q9RF49_9GAMM|nr:SbcC/MukB-like Walker B domain-containing protein [Stutzerimonas kirkiae]TBU98941.1 exonuclease SbcC [Stutzerimonas kirkiae]TBV01591.1 exonuclease SbcC [Stutzerimonas kirkiae]
MKILAIRLKNLASLAGEHSIDFTREPLASAGLFAITGPTGAGKSTLLDALCLALFGSTPRMKEAARQKSSKVPDGDEELSSGDERTLLRRGCGQGYAEVDFIGIDQRRYRARWETNRARERADGRLQPSRQSLLELESGTLLASGRKGEFKELLESRLGLTLEQFTRAVLLAQSEFSAFLKASDDQRSTLLEKLTDTGLYSQLGQAAFDKAKQASEDYKALLQQAGTLQPLDDEARQALQQTLEQDNQRLKTLQQQQRQLERQQQWLQELERLQQEASQADATAQALDDERRQLLGLRDQVARVERLAPQRHRFLRLQELTTLLQDERLQLERRQLEQQHLQQQCETLDNQRQQAQANLGQAEQRQHAAEPRLAGARAAEQRLQHLDNRLQEARAAAQQADQHYLASDDECKRLERERQQLDEQARALDALLQENTALQPLASAWAGYLPRLRQCAQVTDRLLGAEQALPGIARQAERDAKALAEVQQALLELQRQIGTESASNRTAQLEQRLQQERRQLAISQQLQRLWQQQQELRQHQARRFEQQRQQQDALLQVQHDGQLARQQRDAAEQTRNTILALLERQRLARSSEVENLRANLQPGEACPVCGSQEHPWHDPSALLAAFERQDASEAEQANRALQALELRLQELRDRHTELRTRIEQDGQALQEIDANLARLDEQLHALPPYAQLLAQPSAQQADWLERQLQQLTATIEQAEQEQRRLLELQQRIEGLQSQRQALQQQAEQSARQLQRQTEDIERDSAWLEAEMQALKPLLPAPIAQGWRDAPAAQLDELEKQLDAYLQNLQRQGQLNERQRQSRQALELQRNEQQYRQEQRQNSARDLQDCLQQQQAEQRQLQELLDGRSDTQSWQQALRQDIDTARAALEENQREANTARIALIRLDEENQAHARRLQELQAEHERLDERLRQWRSQEELLDEANLARLLAHDDAWLRESRERLQQHERDHTEAHARQQERQSRLHQHRQRQPQETSAETLQQVMAECHQGLEQQEQRCNHSRAALIEDDRRRAQRSALERQITQAEAENQRWGRIASLIGSSDGAAFRRIAQAYNLDLLVQHSNVQLRQLARRYRLKRGGSPLGLLVVDTEMGDELRSVHSLSGGETFLVSLALALGLASMASNRLRIESLFIDEGFGSLDAESLQIAMDALDALQAQGRKVAVISHVQEMHERIPVQIQVLREGNGQSRIEVVG